ncbi:hypothetical protein RF11_13323 [Thelohanellus kitauei]|uniref:Sortilin C-terminal domain-containing protein n=1 Tax=Thelohanellus kitauei TaxID=669202 RepID=A0A0C2N405_THEKT|nr:hypothetical protein RF11_13323 [Thelohanellus kitauei]
MVSGKNNFSPVQFGGRKIKFNWTEPQKQPHQVELDKLRFCKNEDYKIFTPGAGVQAQCFRGHKGAFYKRKNYIYCKSVIHTLSRIIPERCDCTIDDFGW